jgi:lycopene elongase/hydratase (dihydrobisanhydrobacterioruberin-forming)
MTSGDVRMRESGGALRQLFRDLCEISRPGLWLVSLVPFYLGYLLASRHLIPGQDACFPPGGDCLPTLAPVAASLIVWGPLVWLAVLAINDAYDLAGDLLNPRKNTPLTSGRISEGGAKVTAYSAAAVALIASGVIKPGMALATLGFLVCGWVYSVPPLKFKNRPGLDVISNCVALGAFPLLGGWAATRPVDGFPWIVMAVGVLVHIALYMPTMIGDYEADKESGYTTTAVWLGPGGAYWIGMAAWASYCVLTVVLAARGQVYPRSILWFQVGSAPPLIWAYHRFLSRARKPSEIIRGILVVGRLYQATALVFVLAYVGAF